MPGWRQALHRDLQKTVVRQRGQRATTGLGAGLGARARCGAAARAAVGGFSSQVTVREHPMKLMIVRYARTLLCLVRGRAAGAPDGSSLVLVRLTSDV